MAVSLVPSPGSNAVLVRPSTLGKGTPRPSLEAAPTIFINYLIPGKTWADCCWKNGSGTWDSPYVIHDLVINASTGVAGIEIDGDGTGPCYRIENCTIYCGTNNIGIAVFQSGNGTIKNNTIVGSGMYGIEVESSSNCTLSGNTCTGDYYAGIYLTSAGNNTLVDNMCAWSGTGGEGSTPSGIYLTSSGNCTLAANNCTGNYPHGISLASSGNSTLANNVCTGNTQHGIYLNSSGNCTLAANTCNANGQSGIWGDSSGNCSVASNNCSGNTNEGISFSSSDNCTFLANNCSRNDDNGLLLQHAGNCSLAGNNCSRNANCGVNLAFAGNMTATGNNCSRNNYGVYLASSANYTNVTGNWLEKNAVKNVRDLGANNNVANNFAVDFPAANFTENATNVVSGQYVQFTDESTGGKPTLQHEWSFGDGLGNVSAPSPLYMFSIAGTHPTTLTITDADGDLSVCHVDVTVQADTDPVAFFHVNSYTIVAGQNATFTDATAGGNAPLEYQWDFGDGSGPSPVQNPSHRYAAARSFTITLTVTDFGGDVSSYHDTLTVVANLTPLASFTANASTIANGSWVQFTDTTTSGNLPLSYQWNFGDGSANATIANPTHQFRAAGNFTVTLLVTDVDGDVSVVTTLITVTASNSGDNSGTSSVWVYVGMIGGIAAVIAIALVVRSRSKSAAAPAASSEEFGGEFD